MRWAFLLLLLLPLSPLADEAPETDAGTGFDGISLPQEFSRNKTLSVAGQLVFEHIVEGVRELVAITPSVKERSVRILLRGGFRDYCTPHADGIERILFHRRADGLTWFVMSESRTAHIVLNEQADHFEHFLAEVNRLCEPPPVEESEEAST